MVQRQYQFAAVEYGMLEVLVERNGIVRAGIDAKLAEYARTEIVFVLRQYLLFLAVFRFYRLARHLDGVVGASRLAQAAGHAMVFVLLVVGHCQRAAETFGEFQRLPVSGYCSVVFFRQKTVMVVFMPVSREVIPCMRLPM